MRTAQLVPALLCALPLAACGALTPTYVTTEYSDGRLGIEMLNPLDGPLCVNTIGVYEVHDGRRGNEVWSVRENPPSDICQNEFFVGEAPQGFAQSGTGELVEGREYAILVDAGLIRGNTSFAYPLVATE
jgi:hypothetical protein